MGLAAKIKEQENKVREWEGSSPKRKREMYWGFYTFAFIVTAFVVLFVYPSNGRSLVWSVDGLEQYYPFFVYEGQWLRQIFTSLISGEGLQIPLWVHELGYGMDVPSTLDTFFDPLNLLSGLCPERYSEYLFQFLVVFRLYLAGISFSLFAFWFRMGRFQTLIGALLYALCGTAMAVAFWPAGAWPLVLFPLLLLGVEKALDHKGPLLFIGITAAFFIISYYASYAACLLLVPYCALRVFQTNKTVTAKKFIGWTLKFVGFLLIGMMIAAFALVPSLVGLLGLDRLTEAHVDVPFLYSFSYYVSVVAGFVSISEVGSDCYIGFGGIAFFACVLLFLDRGNHRTLKVAFIVMTLMIMLPFVGSLFNGLNYATNRWVWAYALVVAFIVAKMVPRLLSLDRREVKVLVIASAAYLVFIFAFGSTRTEKVIAACLILMLALFVLSQQGLSSRARKASLSFCLIAGLTVNMFYFVSPDEGGIGGSSSPIGSLYSKLTVDSPNKLVEQIEDDSVWRYDASPTATVRTRNDSLVLGLKGIDFYNSTYNSYIDQFHREVGLADSGFNFSYKNLKGRAALEALAGVKYYLMPSASSELPAYNYADPNSVVSTGRARGVDYAVFESSATLPLAFTYDTYIPRTEYEEMTPIQRQDALLQGVVLEDSSLTESTLNLTAQTLPATVSSAQGLVIEDGFIRVTKPNATLQLMFEGLPNSETYVYADELTYEPQSPLQAAEKKARRGMSWYQTAFLYKQNLEWTAPTHYSISMTSDKNPVARNINNTNSTHHMYGGKSDWLVNLGYSEEAQSTVTLTFRETGIYNYDELSVICQPLETLNSYIDERSADPVENLAFGVNEITASVKTEEPRALYFSVPYSEGWRATVDGEEVEIKRANTGFMAIELEPGEHSVRLDYMSPGLLPGLALSCAGLVLFGICAFVSRRNIKHGSSEAPLKGSCHIEQVQQASDVKGDA